MSGADEVFHALADPTRRAILEFLSSNEASPAGRIAQEFELLSRAAVSSHLRVLKNAGLVVERRRGQFREYSLGPNRASQVVEFLQSVYESSLEGIAAELDRASEQGGVEPLQTRLRAG